jgi:hypothetical protein
MRTSGQMEAIAGKGRLPAPITVRASVGGAVNLWYFHSPKNRRRYVFCGELIFLQAILLEADLTVTAYGSPGGTSTTDRQEARSPHLIATNIDGRTTQYYISYIDGSGRAGKEAVTPAGTGERDDVRRVVVTDRTIKDRNVEIDNWIFLCAAMNRVRMHPHHFEAETLRRLASGADGVTLGRALDEAGIDPALMLGAIAAGIQRGSYACETVLAPITLSTVVTRGRTS